MFICVGGNDVSPLKVDVILWKMPDVLTLLLSSSPFLTGLAHERVNAEASTGFCFLSLFLFFKQDAILKERERKKKAFQFYTAAKAAGTSAM